MKYKVYRKMADGSVQGLSEYRSISLAVKAIERSTRLLRYTPKVLYYYCLPIG